MLFGEGSLLHAQWQPVVPLELLQPMDALWSELVSLGVCRERQMQDLFSPLGMQVIAVQYDKKSYRAVLLDYSVALFYSLTFCVYSAVAVQ